jgi:hypothetical protein
MEEKIDGLQCNHIFPEEASAAHGNMPMKIQPDLRRSCGRARDTTMKFRSTRCTQKRNVESIGTHMGAGCTGYSEKFSTCQFM